MLLLLEEKLLLKLGGYLVHLLVLGHPSLKLLGQLSDLKSRRRRRWKRKRRRRRVGVGRGEGEGKCKTLVIPCI